MKPGPETELAIMDRYGLDDEQFEIFRGVMRNGMSDWPQPLQDYVNAKAKEQGFKGDCIARWVSSWIKDGSFERWGASAGSSAAPGSASPHDGFQDVEDAKEP
jgi:hypothetical protein